LDPNTADGALIPAIAGRLATSLATAWLSASSCMAARRSACAGSTSIAFLAIIFSMDMACALRTGCAATASGSVDRIGSRRLKTAVLKSFRSAARRSIAGVMSAQPVMAR
jgi:hypothetical protein